MIPYKKRPSEIPYKLTTWSTAARSLFDNWAGPVATGLALLGLAYVIVSLFYLTATRPSRQELELRCTAACHPAAAASQGRECWCLPEGESAYQPGQSGGTP